MDSCLNLLYNKEVSQSYSSHNVFLLHTISHHNKCLLHLLKIKYIHNWTNCFWAHGKVQHFLLDEEIPCQEQPREKVSVWYYKRTNSCAGAYVFAALQWECVRFQHWPLLMPTLWFSSEPPGTQAYMPLPHISLQAAASVAENGQNYSMSGWQTIKPLCSIYSTSIICLYSTVTSCAACRNFVWVYSDLNYYTLLPEELFRGLLFYSVSQALGSAEKWEVRQMRDGSLSCVGRLTCASGDSSAKTTPAFWLLTAFSDLFRASDFCCTLEAIIGILYCAAFIMGYYVYPHYELHFKICIVFAVQMTEYDACDLVSVWVIRPAVF